MVDWPTSHIVGLYLESRPRMLSEDVDKMVQRPDIPHLDSLQTFKGEFFSGSTASLVAGNWGYGTM